MRLLITIFITFLSVSLHADPLKLDNDRGQLSYSLGYQIGSSLKRQAVDVDPGIVGRGIQDALGGNAPLMTEAEMDKVRSELQQRIQLSQREQAEKEASAKLAAGQAFLEKNQKKAGVITLPSGLQYQVIKKGEGKKPGPQDIVTVNYRGTLIDGTEFDSSYRRNQPATFPLNGVIAGWTEGLQLMQEGAKYKFFIPPQLAYGGHGRLANETLVFEVELISVQPANNKAAD
jgi:FKBP-type peptidyl-prolyl cis-trans isomerase FklB